MYVYGVISPTVSDRLVQQVPRALIVIGIDTRIISMIIIITIILLLLSEAEDRPV